MEDITDWLIEREETSGYTDCKKCEKQLTCGKQYCTGLVKWSRTNGYGIPERKEK